VSKIKYVILVILLLTMAVYGSWRRRALFIETAFNLNAGLTATNGVEFTSKELEIKHQSPVGITVKFTRVAGAVDKVDFAFEASYDSGHNWATFEGVTISVATNHSVVEGTTVAVFKMVVTRGVSHLRLKTVINNDGINNITGVNAILSY